MTDRYDVVVLGSGPGGYVAAIRAAQLGKRVAVVEHKYWGGVCLNVGCIPSKALLRNAELAHLVTQEAETFGIHIDGSVSVDYQAAFTRSRKVADGRVKGVHFLMKKNSIDEIDGWGEFTDPHTLAGDARRRRPADARPSTTASSPPARRRGCCPGTQLSERVVTYEEQILTDNLPGSILIAGAGAIGIEFAYVLNSYGVDVTIVEFLDRILPLEDEEVSAELTRRYKRAGITVLTVHQGRVDRRQRRAGHGHGQQRTAAAADPEVDKVLQAIGFAPRTEGYGLERTGVELTDRGAIAIDDFMRTNVAAHLRHR